MKRKPPKTPFEKAVACLCVHRYRRAAEYMLQIIMEQEKRIAEMNERIAQLELNTGVLPIGRNNNLVVDTSGVTEPQEVNFTDGLE